ncbi:MAG: prephenate dehydratase, partial [Patescibacteria group bacterium]|nr:prephenate dehydratase [Patescibacteria group bacterium]
GSFHDQAARQFFGEAIKMKACDSFRDVFDAVKNGDTEFGVVAIENSLHGSINPVYRLLASQDLWVRGEVRLHIQLYLIGSNKNIPGDFSQITKVRSQAEAISQCDEWLRTNLKDVKIEEANDTAGSVKSVVLNDDTHTVAIASIEAAKIYGSTVLAGPINDDPDNYTRFFILSKEPEQIPNGNRTSIIITENDHDSVGTLHDVLTVFKNHAINLSKLDSHTLPGKIRRYAFYIDYDENYYSNNSQQAVAMIKKIGWSVDILGSYIASEH